MFTPESLLELAIEQRAIYDNSTSIPRTREDMAAYHLSEQAETCAIWLERFGNGQPVQMIGPFGNLPLKKGDKVRIKKGTKIMTYHPKYPNGKIAGRDYVVEVFNVFDGWAPEGGRYHDHELQHKVRNQTVSWAGTGGYWCHVAAVDVEPV